MPKTHAEVWHSDPGLPPSQTNQNGPAVRIIGQNKNVSRRKTQPACRAKSTTGALVHVGPLHVCCLCRWSGIRLTLPWRQPVALLALAPDWLHAVRKTPRQAGRHETGSAADPNRPSDHRPEQRTIAAVLVDGGPSRRDHRRRCRRAHPVGGVLRRGDPAGPDRHARPPAHGAERARDVAPGAPGGGAGQTPGGGPGAITKAIFPDRTRPATASAACATTAHSSSGTPGDDRRDPNADGQPHPGARRLPIAGRGPSRDRPGVRPACRHGSQEVPIWRLIVWTIAGWPYAASA